MPLRNLLFVTLLILLAGCSSTPSEDVTQQIQSAASTSTAPTVPDVPPIPAPQTETCEIVRSNAGTSAGVGLYVDRALGGTGCLFDELFSDLAWARSALVEVEWTAQAGMTAADAWFESDDCLPTPTEPCDLPKESASSAPLSMELTGDGFRQNIDANLEVQVAAQGAVVQQAFKVHITIFANSTVDPGVSALT